MLRCYEVNVSLSSVPFIMPIRCGIGASSEIWIRHTCASGLKRTRCGQIYYVDFREIKFLHVYMHMC